MAPPCPPPSPPAATTQKASPPLLPQGKVLWVYVNLREGPGIQYKIIGKAYMKNSFGILSENPGWLRVRLENGAEGWMSKKAVTLDSSNSSSPQSLPTSSRDSSQIKSSKSPLRPM
ncbi:MAG: SH3 domain-containing protein [Thermodesulfobacteriota bacterium]